MDTSYTLTTWTAGATSDSTSCNKKGRGQRGKSRGDAPESLVKVPACAQSIPDRIVTAQFPRWEEEIRRWLLLPEGDTWCEKEQSGQEALTELNRKSKENRRKAGQGGQIHLAVPRRPVLPRLCLHTELEWLHHQRP